mmetsp:Transcript_17574/g.48750  ORF Transcript_17574/g.48750 Transcript_17574/m.48750 type:complete len:211 (+) Transcript_17574:283-915(+)
MRRYVLDAHDSLFAAARMLHTGETRCGRREYRRRGIVACDGRRHGRCRKLGLGGQQSGSAVLRGKEASLLDRGAPSHRLLQRDAAGRHGGSFGRRRLIRGGDGRIGTHRVGVCSGGIGGVRRDAFGHRAVGRAYVVETHLGQIAEGLRCLGHGLGARHGHPEVPGDVVRDEEASIERLGDVVHHLVHHVDLESLTGVLVLLLAGADEAEV